MTNILDKMKGTISSAASGPASPLADRIALALTVPTTSTHLAVLHEEVSKALAEADDKAKAAEAHALDPTLSAQDAATAAAVATANAFSARRLGVALARLNARPCCGRRWTYEPRTDAE